MQLTPRALLHKIQTSLGADLSDVVIHVGPEALHIGAAAFANGSDIYFAPGFFEPWTPAGELMLAHEFAHVIQQRGGRVGSAAGIVCDEELEAEANWTARRVVAGGRAWLDGRCSGAALFSPAVQCINLIQLGQDAECHKWYFNNNYEYPKLKEVVLLAESLEEVRQFMKDFKNPPTLRYNRKTAVDNFIAARTAAEDAGEKKPGEKNLGEAPKPTQKLGAWGNPAPPKQVQPPPQPWNVGQSSVSNSPTIHGAASAAQNWDDVLPILQAEKRPANFQDAKRGEVIVNSAQTIEVAISIILTGVTYKIVLHFHPEPLNPNFLHFKNKAEATNNHKITWNHWLLKLVGITGPDNMAS